MKELSIGQIEVTKKKFNISIVMLSVFFLSLFSFTISYAQDAGEIADAVVKVGTAIEKVVTKNGLREDLPHAKEAFALLQNVFLSDLDVTMENVHNQIN